MTERYPLHWPEGWPRTNRRKQANFDMSPARSRDEMLREISLMGGRYPLISSNLSLRRDGLPYANQATPSDPGVAVYFQLGDKQMVFACDRWDRVHDNMRAIAKTIEALRGIKRWGASDMMERAFSAFEALPSPKTWKDTFANVKSMDELQRAYREKAKRAHPDAGGSEAAMSELNAHFAAAKKAFEMAGW